MKSIERKPRASSFQDEGKYLLSLVKFVDIDSTEEVVIFFEVDLQRPKNLSVYESEECEYGEGVVVYATLLQSDTL